jgi:Flp pilus assembly protein TadG
MSNKAHWKFFDGMRSRLSRFRRANGANVTITFALATVPMIGLVGAAVDYSHANSVKAAMQAAADATALMLSKEVHKLTASQMQTKANDYFLAMLNRAAARNVTVNAIYNSNQGYLLKINSSADVRTDFMQMMGFSKLKVHADSQVAWGNSRLRVALALDNTGSMASAGKMDALKVATKALLKQLKDAASQNGDVYVSIVPFNKDVNIKQLFPLNSNLLRLDLVAQSLGLGSLNLWTLPNIMGLLQSSWSGCVADRDKNYDTTNTVPTSALLASLFPVEQYDDCPEEIMPLTYNWNKLDAKVDAMKPVGSTNQTIGLQWAFQSLTAAPFTIPAKEANYKYNEVIILMTDGLNTQNRFNDNAATMDARTLATCANAKAAGITIYTIQVNTDGDPTQNFLQTCASSPDKFIELKSANQMVSTFQQIGTQLSNLRISR